MKETRKKKRNANLSNALKLQNETRGEKRETETGIKDQTETDRPRQGGREREDCTDTVINDRD